MSFFEHLFKRNKSHLLPHGLYSLVFVFLCLSCATSGNRAPSILSLQDQQLVTNRSFQLDVTAYDEDADPISFEFSLTPPPPTPTIASAGRPDLQKVSDYNAVFSWTPGNADVGSYALTLIVKDNQGNQSQETINLEVIDTGIGGGQWGRFIEPVGEAAVLNLDETACFETTVAIQADQLAPEEINVNLAPPSPNNASLIADGFKRYRLTWCPDPQASRNQVNFPFVFRANTTRGLPPFEKRFLVRLRSSTSSNCPGSAPTISHQAPLDYRGVENLRLELEVTDDIGVKSAPTLFYQVLNSQTAALGLSDDAWTSVVMNGQFMNGQASYESNVWTGIIPAQPVAEPVTIYYRFLVSDDDDPDGVSCDHSVESEVFQVSYQWDPSLAQIGANLCEPCVDDLQCGTTNDRCINQGQGESGICAQSCDANQGCPQGYQCQEALSINQVSSLQCVSETACGVTCLPDRFETTVSTPGPMDYSSSEIQAGFYDMLSICGGDEDHYTVNIPSGLTLTARIEFDHGQGDLDMRASAVSPMDAVPPTSSLNVRDFEEVVLSCVPTDTQAVIQVFGYEGAQNQYTLSVQIDEQECEEYCQADAYEMPIPNNDTLNASFVDLNQAIEGTICPQDVDIFGYELEAGNRIEIRLEHMSSQSDLAIEILDQSDQRLAFSNALGRDVELLEFTPSVSAEYYVIVYHPQGTGNVNYTLSVRGGSSLCTQTNDCAEGLYCDANNSCVPNACDAMAGCDSGHVCVSPIAGRLPVAQNGLCTASCSSVNQCRTGEGCKAFENYTSRCAPSGAAQLADPCSHFSDCANDLVCLPAPGGYCATAGCRSNLDCSNQSICESLQGIKACLKSCVTDSDCSRSDLYCRDFPGGKACAP